MPQIKYTRVLININIQVYEKRWSNQQFQSIYISTLNHEAYNSQMYTDKHEITFESDSIETFQLTFVEKGEELAFLLLG